MTTSAPSTARWPMVCAGTALIGTCYGFARFAYGLFAPEFQDTFAMSSFISGIIGSGSYVGYCIAIVLSLALTERLGARRVALGAGVVATAGCAAVAVAPSTTVLAAGVLVAGSSTGLASPPMAAAVSRWVRNSAQDRAQSIVNAGTGIGVLVSGPVALLLLEQWRWAWAAFAVLAAAVTVWIGITVPHTTSESSRSEDERGIAPGTGRLMLGAFCMGLSSVAVWTFGRSLITSEGGASGLTSTTMWMIVGATGFLGALSGDLVARAGLARSWTATLLAMAASTLMLALAPGSVPATFVSGAVFGAGYVCLCGLVLLWSTRIYPRRASFGVGVSFLMIAVGQAVGAPLAGALTDTAGGASAFWACAAIGALGALVRPHAKLAAATSAGDVPKTTAATSTGRPAGGKGNGACGTADGVRRTGPTDLP